MVEFSGGMVHLRDGANTQYVTGTAHLFSVYSNILAQFNQKVVCGGQQFDHTRLMAFAKQQVLLPTLFFLYIYIPFSLLFFLYFFLFYLLSNFLGSSLNPF